METPTLQALKVHGVRSALGSQGLYLMPTLSSTVAPEVVVTTTSSAATDDKVMTKLPVNAKAGIMTIFGFQSVQSILTTFQDAF